VRAIRPRRGGRGRSARPAPGLDRQALREGPAGRHRPGQRQALQPPAAGHDHRRPGEAVVRRLARAPAGRGPGRVPQVRPPRRRLHEGHPAPVNATTGTRKALRALAAVTLAALTVAAAACTSSGGTARSVPSSAALLSDAVSPGPAAAGMTWPVFGGGTDNTRFSALGQITTGNVARLGVAWSKPLGQFSSLNESYPVMIGRTVYLTTSTDEVMAFDAASGVRNWSYAPMVDFSLSRGVGGYGVAVNRGVAVSGGKVYLLTFDDRLRAVSQATGEELWSTVVADAHTGAYETSAPTAWRDLIFGGDSGSEDGVRGFVAAFHAADGSPAWRFWTVPA